MLDKVKKFLRIDPSMTDDDETLEIIIKGAIQELESSTGKCWNPDSEMMVTYIMLQTKLTYEQDSSTALLKAITSMGNQIKVSSDFAIRETGGEVT